MFETETYFKAFFVFAAAFITYNHVVALRRDSVLNDITATQSITEISSKLGNPVEIYHCATDTNQPSTFDKTAMCISGVQDVYTFQRCSFIALCRGWNYVLLDQAGHPVSKSSWIAPLFPGGPAF